MQRAIAYGYPRARTGLTGKDGLRRRAGIPTGPVVAAYRGLGRVAQPSLVSPNRVKTLLFSYVNFVGTVGREASERSE